MFCKTSFHDVCKCASVCDMSSVAVWLALSHQLLAMALLSVAHVCVRTLSPGQEVLPLREVTTCLPPEDAVASAAGMGPGGGLAGVALQQAEIRTLLRNHRTPGDYWARERRGRLRRHCLRGLGHGLR